MRIDATIKLTEALTISKAGFSRIVFVSKSWFDGANLFSILSLILDGIIFCVLELIISKNLTKYFASRFALNLSLISLWSDKSIEVFKTFFALDENHSVITIIAPARNSITFGVSTLEDSTSIVSWSGGIPEISHAS